MIANRIRAGLRLIAAVALLSVVAACAMFYDAGGEPPYRNYVGAPKTPPPPSDQPRRSVAPPPAAVSVQRIPVPSDGLHNVERGNTVYAISRLYGVPVRAIIEANELTPPYLLKVGDRLRIPAPRVHMVIKGDTVYSISRRYEVPMNELMRANGIAPPFTIVIGQQLIIPAEFGRQTPLAATTPPAGTGESTSSASPPNKRATPAQVAALPNPPPRASRMFEWPVAGKVVLGFGGQPGGSHNDGINIAAPRGSRVVAAENGIVAYAGNELRGFGNLVLIKHADGYMTAYAHNDGILVSRGQKVTKGQVIAHVGSTGSVATPQLHFEIRKGRTAMDPVKYLPRRSASR